MTPSRVERNRRRATRPIRRIDSVPMSAAEKRQPNEGVDPEEPLARGDHPLADRRVDDEVARGA